MKIKTFFLTVFAVMFVLGSAPFFVNYLDAQSRVRTVHGLEAEKGYNDAIMAVGLQIRGIQNAFIRAALEKTAAGPDMDKLRGVVVSRNSDLDKLFADTEARFTPLADQDGSASRENYDRFMTSARGYQSAIAKILQNNDFTTKAIDEVAPFINAALGEVGKEVKASNERIADASALLLSEGAHYRSVYMLANGVILAIIVVAFLLMDRKIFRRLETAVSEVRQIQSGDLRVHIRDTANDELSQLLKAIATMAGELGRLIDNIDSQGSRLHDNAGSIRTAAAGVNDAAAQQAEATASMAAAIEELTASSDHVAEHAGDTERYSSNAATMSDAAAAQLDQTNGTMHQIAESVIGASGQISALNERAGQISNIAAVIKDIAGQTNLLALNAAIEAARAGEQGRGFAVVADEVRKLAERTASATNEIESMIVGIQQDTGNVVETMAQILPRVEEGKHMTGAAAEALANIRAEAQQTLAHIQDIAGAIREQSAANASLAQKVDVVARMAEQTAEKSRTSTDIASHLTDMAAELRNQIRHFTR